MKKPEKRTFSVSEHVPAFEIFTEWPLFGSVLRVRDMAENKMTVPVLSEPPFS
jgi:hypothetical protein